MEHLDYPLGCTVRRKRRVFFVNKLRAREEYLSVVVFVCDFHRDNCFGTSINVDTSIIMVRIVRYVPKFRDVGAQIVFINR